MKKKLPVISYDYQKIIAILAGNHKRLLVIFFYPNILEHTILKMTIICLNNLNTALYLK
jgi:hypothetical protein